MNFEIEIAVTDHVDDVLGIADKSGLSAWSRDEYVREVQRHDALFYVATVRNRGPVGFIVGRLMPSANSDSYVAEIFNTAVRREFRRTGIGSELFNRFRSEAREKGASQVFLEVRSRNRVAIEFYKKHGFEVYSMRRRYYADPPDDATLMRSELKFGGRYSSAQDA